MIKKMNVSLVKVVNILNDGQYHDGTKMGARLEMTRSAVWKIIKKLQNYDIKIDSIKGKGYALLEPLILLDAKKIKKALEKEKFNLTIFESIDSTNDFLKNQKNTNDIHFCIAEQQTQGKGRLHREWHSPFGKNIYLSCLYPFQKDISELGGLSLIVGLAVVKTVQHFGFMNAKMKWPNDIIYDNNKLAGVLVEIQAETHGTTQAIIGIGLNVNMTTAKSKDIHQVWTSLKKISGNDINRNEVCIMLIKNLLHYLNQFNQSGFRLFMDEWKSADSLFNQEITVKNVNDKIQGKVLGINDQGHLLVELPNGIVRGFSSGDTSILKKDG